MVSAMSGEVVDVGVIRVSCPSRYCKCKCRNMEEVGGTWVSSVNNSIGCGYGPCSLERAGYTPRRKSGKAILYNKKSNVSLGPEESKRIQIAQGKSRIVNLVVK